MPPRVLLDTDILSEVIKEVDRNVAVRAEDYIRQHGALTFSSATVLEILYGFHRRGASARAQSAKWWFSKHQEIVPGEAEYRLAAEIMGALDRRGTPVGPFDPLIAACAINRRLGVATGNTRHFGYIVAAGFSLRLEDWRRA